MAHLAWVTGAGGLIGSHIIREAPRRASGWHIRPLTREQLDLCDGRAVSEAFAKEQPEVVIHCAAMSRSVACQADPALAWRINHQATLHLAQLAAGVQFVFFSSDLVFDGREGHYRESAPVNPLSVYAETKAAAEQVVLANPGHTVVRTSLTAGDSPTRERGCDEQLCMAWRKGQTTRLFTDEFRSPIPATATARAIWEIVEKRLCGLFHLSGAERLSRLAIGELIAARCRHLRARIEPGSFKDYSGPPRPPDTSLDSGKIQDLLSFQLPSFTEWIQSQIYEARSDESC